MLQVTSEVATSVEILMMLWKHECSRVIADRFVGKQDSDWFEKAMKQVATDIQQLYNKANNYPMFQFALQLPLLQTPCVFVTRNATEQGILLHPV